MMGPDSGYVGLQVNGAREREQPDRGVIKYRYRTHPAILANIPLSIESQPTIGQASRPREGFHEALSVAGSRQWQQRRQRQQQHTAFDSGQSWADQIRSTALGELNERAKLRGPAVIEIGDDEVRRLDYDDAGANGGEFKPTERCGQLYAAQVKPVAAHHRRLELRNRFIVEPAMNCGRATDETTLEPATASRLMERQRAQLRLIYLAHDKEEQFVQADARSASAPAPSNLSSGELGGGGGAGNGAGSFGKWPGWISVSS